MSGSLQAPSAPAPSGGNPLAAAPKEPQAGASGVDHPQFHAKAAQHVESLDLNAHDLSKEASLATYAANEFAKLAGNPNVKPRDVLKASADAVAAGKAQPSGVISLLSQMPSDANQLRPWLKTMYMVNLTAAVHLKAKMIRDGIPLESMDAPKRKAAK